MKKSYVILLGLVAALAHPGFHSVQAEETSHSKDISSPFSVQPFEIPEQFQDRLKDYRNTWPRMTGFEYSGLHWNQFIVVYLNKGADAYRNNYAEYLRFYQDFDEDDYEDEDDIPEPSFESYPVGTVVLKENFIAAGGAPNTPVSVTMMLKHEPGYDAAGGNWEYVQFDATGNVILRGNSQDDNINQACASCHINISDRDYIFANFFSKSN